MLHCRVWSGLSTAQHGTKYSTSHTIFMCWDMTMLYDDISHFKLPLPYLDNTFLFLLNHSSIGEYMLNPAACLICDAGYFSNVTGSVICQACQPGYFRFGLRWSWMPLNSKIILCFLISLGLYFYSSGKGVTTCQMCAEGSYAVLPGQTMCKVDVNQYSALFRELSFRCISSAHYYVFPCSHVLLVDIQT